MIYGSVCSGIESASVAWEPLGWHPAWFSEIEAFPSAVLDHRFPGVANLGDMTTIAGRVRSGDVAAPDVLVGGTPCQAFSLAGLRGGLSDPRGALTISYVELANAIDDVRRGRGEPECVTVWENVPGVLSSKDNAFGCFLGALAGEDCELQPPGKKWANAGCVFGLERAIAWRVLDAQYFGVAQRRRRVFVVASARKGFDPSAVLFESEGVRRDTAPSREAGEDVAGTLASRSTGGGFPGTDEACSGYLQPVVARSVSLRGRDGGATAELGGDVAGTLRASSGGGDKPYVLCMAHGQGGAEIAENRAPTLTCNHEAPIVVHGTQDPCVGDVAFALGRNNGQENAVLAFSCKDYGAVAGELSPTLRAMSHSGSHANAGGQVAVAIPLLEVGKRTGKSTDDRRAGLGVGGDGDPMYTLQDGAQHGVCITGNRTHALTAEGFDASEDGTGRGTPIIAAFAENSRAELRYEDGDGGIVGALSTGGGKAGQGTPTVQIGTAVRRLTPRECERLQGFPDDYTLIPTPRRTKLEADELAYIRERYPDMPEDEARRLAADGPRYKALGNSMAVPCMAWIGRRIACVAETARAAA